MDAPVAEKRMEDEAEAGVCRFANELQLSELPSSKQLDEVGKYSSVGSVAQKKAYFESQYKIIASQNPEKVEKVKKKVTKMRDAVVMEDQTQRDWLGDSNAVEPGLNVDKSIGQNGAIAVESESEMQNSECKDSSSEVIQSKDFVDKTEVQRSGCRISSSETIEMKNIAHEMKETIDPSPVTEHAKDESCFRPGTPELCKSEEVEQSPQIKARINASETKQERREKVKSEKSLKSQRPTSAKREVSTSVAKKTPTSCIPKSSFTPAPKLSRPTLSKSITPTPKALPKKENSKSPLTSKKLTSAECRRVAPTSLHMSLNLETRNPGDMSATMRKSLIMEKMGDKDIVKRAFQSFRNRLSSSDSSKPSAESEISGKPVNTNTSLVGTPRKKTEGGNRVVKKLSPLSSQTGTGKPTNATRRQNTVGVDLRANRSHDMAEERNKVSKKVEDKGYGKAAERTQLHSKEKKEAEIKRQKPKQSLELEHKKDLFT